MATIKKISYAEKKKISFQLGQVVATPAAMAALEKNKQNGAEFLDRHSKGDWGEIAAEDAKQNDGNFSSGADSKSDMLHSVYKLDDGTKIWIITEWTREVTTILLPEDY